MSQKWKMIRVREEDGLLIQALQTKILESGVGRLPKAVQDQLSTISAGQVVSAGLVMLLDHLQADIAREETEKILGGRKAAAKGSKR